MTTKSYTKQKDAHIFWDILYITCLHNHCTSSFDDEYFIHMPRWINYVPINVNNWILESLQSLTTLEYKLFSTVRPKMTNINHLAIAVTNSRYFYAYIIYVPGNRRWKCGSIKCNYGSEYLVDSVVRVDVLWRVADNFFVSIVCPKDIHTVLLCFVVVTIKSLI